MMAQMPVITAVHDLDPDSCSRSSSTVGAGTATAMTMAAGLTGLGLAGGSSEWIAMMGLKALMVA